MLIKAKYDIYKYNPNLVIWLVREMGFSIEDFPMKRILICIYVDSTL